MIRNSPHLSSGWPPFRAHAGSRRLRAEMAEAFRSGDALFAYGADMRILLWNEEAERLTGVPAAEAVGRACWDVVRGIDEHGALLCHPGCSGARLAREGWPVPCARMLIRTEEGRKLVSVSTISVRLPQSEQVVLQLLRNGDAVANGRKPEARLTPRQCEVLGLLADGIPAKVIATRLGIREVTVRNHIQAILIELRCHSQLEAVAEARRRGVL